MSVACRPAQGPGPWVCTGHRSGAGWSSEWYNASSACWPTKNASQVGTCQRECSARPGRTCRRTCGSCVRPGMQASVAGAHLPCSPGVPRSPGIIYRLFISFCPVQSLFWRLALEGVKNHLS
ncbi:hypothetical protein B0H10DRAFT_2184770 [Mycena sp. CBHHK59/15]|nr:hypothetical protein B0H10DRAFT_2184770 [Mycena sp. CBHHK59/15]